MSSVKKVFAKLKEVFRETFGQSKEVESAKSKGKKPASNTKSVSFSASSSRTGRSKKSNSIHKRQQTPGPSSSRRRASSSTTSHNYSLFGVPGGYYDHSFFDHSTSYGGGFDAGCHSGGGDAGGSCGCD